jgi:hypothetical protein
VERSFSHLSFEACRFVRHFTGQTFLFENAAQLHFGGGPDAEWC